ncbi:MAG: F0F1 ATP synthase subunit delta [Treponema sp.]|jgi:F-type H+-transporting ATPase subunit delta|nr:F0F1 ATP synthase subunit delta [Treponema sp.]
MFLANRWAFAFTSALDTLMDDLGIAEQPDACRNLEEGLNILKVFVPCIKKIPGYISGRGPALRVEGLLRASGGKTTEESSLENRRIEIAVRFISLLIRKNSIRHADAVIKKIETILDQRKGIVQISLETAFPLEEDFEERLKGLLRRKTAAGEIRLKTRENRELLGGYRLIIGGSLIDTSLSTLLQKMAAGLSLPIN